MKEIRSASDRVETVFRSKGWSVSAGEDLLVRKGRVRYAVEVKRSAESRRDRLIPLVAQTVLQALTVAQRHPGARALAVVVVPRLTTAVIALVERFVDEHAPEVPVGLVDERGSRRFLHDPLLEKLNADGRAADGEAAAQARKHVVDPFSGHNQLLLKFLLAEHLRSPGLLNAPTGSYRNASELAGAAGVSVMTAFRLVRFLEEGGFLDQTPKGLRLARLDELLERWQASAALRIPPGIHARWLLPGKAHERMSRLVDALGEESCLGLFAAADAHGLGVVRGVPADVYVRTFSPANAKRAGLIVVEQGESADVIFRVPASRASVFRCAVVTSAGRAADVLQVWLDVAHHPSRGKEQAEHIRRRVIDPMLKHARNS